MKPGPELDALVAEKVLGWREMDYAAFRTMRGPEPTWVKNAEYECVVDFRPSRDLTTCAAAAEEARKAGKIRAWNLWSPDSVEGVYASSVWYEPSHPDRCFTSATSESAAHALALALLKACE